jgi:hypothetical protein
VTAGSVAGVLRRPGGDARFPGTLLAGLLAGASALAGLAVGEAVLSGHAGGVFAVAVLALPVVLWFRPQVGPIVIVAAAATIEQFPYLVGTRNGAATDRIPFFQGLDKSLHVTPADLLLLILVAVWVMKRGTSAVAPLTRSAVRTSILALLAAVALGLAVGLAHHGNLRVALMEVRPYVYLAAAYLFASVFLTSRDAVRAVLWALVLGSGFKACQGLLIFLWARNLDPRPEALLGHEEAFFFGLFVCITLGLWLFQVPGSLRTTATVLLPVVVAADLVNSRRTAWLVLAAGLLTLVAVGFACLAERRRFLKRLLVCVALFSAVYVPAYWNHTGGLAQPARALRSVIKPDTRDAASDLYRVQENANLKLNIRQGAPIGKGFGVPIDYALPIVDIGSIDPLIAYIPHNGVLYVLMRMGILGGIAFWSLLGAGIVTGCRLARVRDRELALVGALIVCALLAYALQGYNDQGFFFYRIALVIGSLLGLGEAVRRLAPAEEAAA